MMDRKKLIALLERHRRGQISSADVVERLKGLPFEEEGRTTFDTHRELRTGMREVIYSPGKTRPQLAGLVERSVRNHDGALVTRVDPETGRFLGERFPAGRYHEIGRIFALGGKKPGSRGRGRVAVVTGGAADENVAEEATLTLEHAGVAVDRLYDVGVAGIHRLLGRRGALEEARVVIAVAGMEGALASVVAGLTSRPVIAVPTSSGYGASFGGLAALLSMLNSCAGGVAVVNIDGGFNAACAAHRIIGVKK